MEKEEKYSVEITSKAEQYYWDLLTHLYKYHSISSANKKSDELLELAMSLEINPHRGTIEKDLNIFKKQFRYLVYKVTNRKTIKIIYYIEDSTNKVYITDFFATLMNPEKKKKRN